MCADFRPELKSFLIVKCHRYHTYTHDIMWDGATIYLNKETMGNKTEKVFFDLHCTHGCNLNTPFHQESELRESMLPYIETLFQELAQVPAPPTKTIIPIVVAQQKKYVLKLVPRKIETAVY